MKLNKIIFIAILVFAGISTAIGQTSDYKKTEFFGGFSNNQVEGGAINSFDRAYFNGFEASGVYNVHRYFGIKGDVSGTYKNRKNSFTTNNNTISFEQNRAVYNFLGGVQIKDNSSDAKVKPFAHVLAGVGNVRNKTKNYACTGPNCPTFVNLNGTFSETGLRRIASI